MEPQHLFPKYNTVFTLNTYRDVTHFMGVMNEMVEPIELEREGTETTLQESFIQDESTIHLSYTGEWILQVTHHQVVSLQQQQQQHRCGDVETPSLFSILRWERKVGELPSQF